MNRGPLIPDLCLVRAVLPSGSYDVIAVIWSISFKGTCRRELEKLNEDGVSSPLWGPYHGREVSHWVELEHWLEGIPYRQVCIKTWGKPEVFLRNTYLASVGIRISEEIAGTHQVPQEFLRWECLWWSWIPYSVSAYPRVRLHPHLIFPYVLL